MTTRLFTRRDTHFSPGTYRRSVHLGNRETRYLLRVPPDQDAEYPTPLVLLLENNPGDALRKTGWEARADGVGFLVAATDTTDAAALRAVWEDIRRQVPLDPARLFLWGRNASPLASSLPNVAAVAGEVAPKNIPFIALSGKRECGPAWEFFDHNPRYPQPPVLTRLTVQVTGLRNDRGNVPIAVYRGVSGFGDPHRAFASDTVSIRGDRTTTVFAKLPPDDYAVLILHDENANGKMDTSFGYPLEGFGASNNPKPRFGPPTFAETHFHIAGDTPDRRITIRVIYL